MILVTGASGFIGKYVIEELQTKNISVLAVSRNDQKASHNLSWLKQDIESEISDYNSSLIQKCNTLIHLAWDGLPNYRSLAHLEEQFLIQYKFIKNCIELGIHNIVIIGSCQEYGMQEGELSTDSIVKPATSYAIAKDTLHRWIYNLKSYFDFQFKWIRLFYVFGEGQANYTLYGQILNAIQNNDEVFNMSSGEQRRDFIHVQEVAKQIVEIASFNNNYHVYNCSSGRPVSVLEFVESIIKQFNSKIKLNKGFYSIPDYEPISFWGKPFKSN